MTGRLRNRGRGMSKAIRLLGLGAALAATAASGAGAGGQRLRQYRRGLSGADPGIAGGLCPGAQRRDQLHLRRRHAGRGAGQARADRVPGQYGDQQLAPRRPHHHGLSRPQVHARWPRPRSTSSRWARSAAPISMPSGSSSGSGRNSLSAPPCPSRGVVGVRRDAEPAAIDQSRHRRTGVERPAGRCRRRSRRRPRRLSRLGRAARRRPDRGAAPLRRGGCASAQANSPS